MNNFAIERVASLLRSIYDVSVKPAQKSTAAVIRKSFNTRDAVGVADKSTVLVEVVWYWDGTYNWDGTRKWGPI
jgi:capsid portal protein